MKPSPLELPNDASRWAKQVIDWFIRHQRDLPWRSDPDPYLVWLSEIMLQQTQVKTMLPYFERFIATYPTVEDLAAAEEAEVLDLWAGLGYYRRARNLHKAARVVCRDFQGEFPRGLEDLLRLPGVGRYSAGAILSIAYGLPHPVLDGNVKRVLSRYLAVQEPLADSAFWKLLDQTVAIPMVAANVSAFNQGLMELGATVCTPNRPRCPACPLKNSCRAHQLGLETRLPPPRRRRETVEQVFTVVVIADAGKYLMQRNEQGLFLRGFWEFPRLAGLYASHRALRLQLQAEFGLSVSPEERIAEIRHQITFRRLRFVAIRAVLREAPSDARWTWLAPLQKGYPMSAYVRKVLASV